MAVLFALVASVMLNVYLFATRQGSRPAGTSPATAEASRTPSLGSSAATVTTAGSAPGKQPSPSRYKDLDRAMLEQRLADTETRIHDLLPMDQRFKVDEPNPDLEERVRPHLERMYKVKPGETPPYELQCRGNVCHVTKVDLMDFQDRVHEDEESMGMFEGVLFGSDVYMEVAEPAKAAAFRLQGLVLRSLYEGEGSKGISECKQNNRTPTGKLEVAVNLDPASRKFVVVVEGDLAKQSVGVCVRRVVEDAIARIEVPAEVTMMEQAPISITVP